MRAAAEYQTGNALNDAVEYEKTVRVYTEELPQAIVDDATVTAAKKSLPVCAIPIMLEVVTRALRACR